MFLMVGLFCLTTSFASTQMTGQKSFDTEKVSFVDNEMNCDLDVVSFEEVKNHSNFGFYVQSGNLDLLITSFKIFKDTDSPGNSWCNFILLKNKYSYTPLHKPIITIRDKI
jgi:hypothetical protein